MAFIGRAIFAVSLIAAAPLPAAAAGDCKPPQVLHTMSMVGLRDGRFAIPVTFGASQGALVLDSADVSDPPLDGRRKTVPATNTRIEEWTVAAPSYAGIAGSLTEKTVRDLGLTPSSTGARIIEAGVERAERKVSVHDFAMLGLTPLDTQFVVSEGDSRTADYSGTFSINNFRQFSFDLDLDFAGGSAKLVSRDRCPGPPADWQAASIASLRFIVDGNGYLRIPVTVDGRKLEAVLDTGSPITTLDFGTASRSLRVRENDPALAKVAETSDGRAVYSRPFGAVAFGDVSVADPTLILVPGITGRSEGPPTGSRVDRDKKGTLAPLVIGMSVLRPLHLYFAFDEKRLYVAQGEAASSQ